MIRFSKLDQELFWDEWVTIAEAFLAWLKTDPYFPQEIPE